MAPPREGVESLVSAGFAFDAGPRVNTWRRVERCRQRQLFCTSARLSVKALTRWRSSGGSVLWLVTIGQNPSPAVFPIIAPASRAGCGGGAPSGQSQADRVRHWSSRFFPGRSGRFSGSRKDRETQDNKGRRSLGRCRARHVPETAALIGAAPVYTVRPRRGPFARAQRERSPRKKRDGGIEVGGQS